MAGWLAGFSVRAGGARVQRAAASGLGVGVPGCAEGKRRACYVILSFSFWDGNVCDILAWDGIMRCGRKLAPILIKPLIKHKLFLLNHAAIHLVSVKFR